MTNTGIHVVISSSHDLEMRPLKSLILMSALYGSFVVIFYYYTKKQQENLEGLLAEFTQPEPFKPHIFSKIPAI
jgi:hypothetical protein